MMEVERDELYIHSEKLFDILRTRCPEKIAQFERSKNCLDHRIWTNIMIIEPGVVIVYTLKCTLVQILFKLQWKLPRKPIKTCTWMGGQYLLATLYSNTFLWLIKRVHQPEWWRESRDGRDWFSPKKWNLKLCSAFIGKDLKAPDKSTVALNSRIFWVGFKQIKAWCTDTHVPVQRFYHDMLLI